MFFDSIPAAPADPILGLGEAFKAETRAEKVNLGIGGDKDANGQTPILRAVKAAETRLLASENSKNYLGIDGVAAYNAATQELLFGADHEIIANRRAKTAQSLGGTGALRVAAEFIKRHTAAQNRFGASASGRRGAAARLLPQPHRHRPHARAMGGAGKNVCQARLAAAV